MAASDVGCDLSAYERPAVAIGLLPAAESMLVQALTQHQPMGGTPMGPAVKGALGQLQAYRAAHPGHKAALVLASDGLPVVAGRPTAS
jgi:Mg-chelatase subunit ChlD